MFNEIKEEDRHESKKKKKIKREINMIKEYANFWKITLIFHNCKNF